jgi:hypothetical protein
VCKVFEEQTLGLDFGCGYGAKVESPACAGLWFLPDLIVAGVSRAGAKGLGLKFFADLRVQSAEGKC